MRPIDEVLSQPGGLAERLYALRKGAGVPVGVLAERLRWVPSKVSKIQRGQQRPTAADIQAWADACGHPEAASELLDLLAEAEAVHWRWQQRLSHRQEDLDQRVRRAKRIRSIQVTVIPGLLQTAEYARHVIIMFHELADTGLDELDAEVASRMRRQEVLYDPGRTFEFVINQNVLHRHVGDPGVMRGQLDRLIQLSSLPNITLGVFPDAPYTKVFPFTAFLMLDGKVSIEGLTGEDRLPPREGIAYQRMMDAALAGSVTGDEAAALIREAAAAL